MTKLLSAGLAVSAILTAATLTPAEARCWRTGHHYWSCGYHRAHYAHRAGYRYAYPYYGTGYGYYGSGTAGYGSSYSSAATMGPSPRSGGGP